MHPVYELRPMRAAVLQYSRLCPFLSRTSTAGGGPADWRNPCRGIKSRIWFGQNRGQGRRRMLGTLENPRPWLRALSPPLPPPHTRARPLRAAACLCGNPPRERGGPGAEVAAALPAAFLQNAGNGAARCRRGLAGGRPGAARGRPATSRACAGPDPGLRTPFPSPSPLLPPPPPHRLPPPPLFLPRPSRIPGGPAVPPPAGRLPTKKGAGRECRTMSEPAHAARMRPPRPDEGAG